MKKFFMLATAAFLISGVAFAQEKQEKTDKKCAKGKECCKKDAKESKEKECCKKDAKSKEAKTAKPATKKAA